MNAPAKKNEVVTVQAPAVIIPQSDAASLLSVISRASTDPNVDVVKMRELMTMRREIIAEEREQAFNDAMALAQKDMRRIAADKDNTQTKSKYASYAALDRAIRPIYTNHGFSLSFDTEPTEKTDWVRVVCYASSAGHTRKYKIDMPADGKGAKGGDVMTKTHATGSATSYGRRYLLLLIFNLAIGEDDDDGNAASGKRENPHVTRPEDVTDAKPRFDENGQRIDWIDTSQHRVERLSKANARPVAQLLNVNMRKCKTAGYLVEWGIEHSEQVASLPRDWEEIFQGRYQEFLDELRAKDEVPHNANTLKAG